LKNAKKIFVIGLMALLVLSVTLSALTFYSRAPPMPSVQTFSDLNSQLNTLVSGCIQSLPNGTQECDTHLNEVVSKLCQQSNDSLDACNDGKVQQYYQKRHNS